MSYSPDSMLTAARKLAEAARLPWAAVQRVYRELQELDFLPKSVGRQIWFAHPNMMVSLLIGLALPRGTPAVKENIELFRILGREGASIETEWLQAELMRLLLEPDAALDLDHIAFEIDTGRAVVTRGGVETIYFIEREELLRDGSVRDAANDPPPLIFTRGVISGDLFRAISGKVKWRLSGPPTTSAALADAEG